MNGSQIVRMLNGVNFEGTGTLDGSKGTDPVDLCPASLEKDIDDMNDFIYDKVTTIVMNVYCITCFTGRLVTSSPVPSPTYHVATLPFTLTSLSPPLSLPLSSYLTQPPPNLIR